MVASIVYDVPDAEFADIVESSPSVSQVIDRIGGGSSSTVKKRMKEMGVELAKRNGAAKKSTKKKASKKQASRKKTLQQQRRDRMRPESRPAPAEPRFGSSRRRSLWKKFPWPVIGTLAGVGTLIFLVDQFSRSSAQAVPSAKEQENIDDLKTWINRNQSVSRENFATMAEGIESLDQAYAENREQLSSLDARMQSVQALAQNNQSAIQELEAKKIPSLEDTKQILSDVTKQNEEFKDTYARAQERLQEVESRLQQSSQRVDNLESKLKSARQQSAAATEQTQSADKQPGPTTFDRVAWAIAGFVVGGVGGAFVGQGVDKLWPSNVSTEYYASQISPTAAFIGLAWGAIGAGWPFR